MKKTGLYWLLGIFAVVILVVIIWQVKTMSGSQSAESKKEISSAGKTIYIAQCARCHGREGQGYGENPDIRNNGHSVAEIKEIVRNGLAEMPAFSNLSEKEITELADYVSTL
jgi:mono/diheme cytochrome c family protein